MYESYDVPEHPPEPHSDVVEHPGDGWRQRDVGMCRVEGCGGMVVACPELDEEQGCWVDVPTCEVCGAVVAPVTYIVNGG
jgi:hypothetical protein